MIAQLNRIRKEILRRRVVGAVSFYALGAWLTLQVLDIAFPAFGIPDSSLRFVFLAIITAFPLLLIYAWRYDISGGEIVRTPPSAKDDAPSLAGRDKAILSFLGLGAFTITAAALVSVLDSREPSSAAQPTGLGPSGKTLIAVLPFRNLGNSRDTFFASGMTEEISSKLAAIESLGVIASESVRRYAANNKEPNRIVQDLGVDYLLSGTVMWADSQDTGSRVRISLQLIRSNDFVQTWSEVYDRQFADVFDIQEDVARKVSENVELTLAPIGIVKSDEPPTKNLDAYRAYLRAYSNATTLCAAADESTRHLEEATRLDPGFADAWARLGNAYSSQYTHCLNQTAEQLTKLRLALSHALRLRPDGVETIRLHARYTMQVEQDYQQSLKILADAGDIVDRDASLVNLRGKVKRRVGNFDEAVVDLSDSFVLDPRNWSYAMQTASALLYLRQYEHSMDYFRQSVAIEPGAQVNYMRMCLSHWMRGSVDGCTEVLGRTPGDVLENDALIWTQFWQAIYRGDYDDALAVINRHPNDWVSALEENWPSALLTATAHELSGDQERASQEFEVAQSQLAAALDTNPYEPKYLRAQAIAFAGTERFDLALEMSARANEVYPLDEHPYFGIENVANLALVQSSAGNIDDAIALLRSVIAIPSLLSVPLLELDPRWQTVVCDKGFDEVRKRYGDRNDVDVRNCKTAD